MRGTAQQVDLAIYTDPILSSKLEYMPLKGPSGDFIPQSSPLISSSPYRQFFGAPRGDRVPALPLAAVHSCHPRAGAVLRGECFLQKISCHSTGPSPGGIRRYPLQSGCGIALFPHTTVIQHSHGSICRKVTLYTATSSLPGKRPHPLPECKTIWRFMVNQRLEAEIRSITIPHCPNRTRPTSFRPGSFRLKAFSLFRAIPNGYRRENAESRKYSSASYDAIVRFASKTDNLKEMKWRTQSENVKRNQDPWFSPFGCS